MQARDNTIWIERHSFSKCKILIKIIKKWLRGRIVGGVFNVNALTFLISSFSLYYCAVVYCVVLEHHVYCH